MQMDITERNTRAILSALATLDAVDASDPLEDRFLGVTETTSILAAGLTAMATLDALKADGRAAFAASLVRQFGDLVLDACDEAVTHFAN